MTASLVLGVLLCIRILGAFHQQIEGLMKAGFKDLSAAQLQAAAINRMSPRYAKSVATTWPGELSFDDLVDVRITGVSENFVATLRRAEHKDLSPYKALDLPRRSVRTSYIRPTSYGEQN